MEVISILESVRKGMEDNIFNYTKGGKCSSCSNCCSNLLPMSQKEVDVIRKYIKKHGIKECKHLLPVATPVFDMTCPFRDNGRKICTIYPVRPEICRQFICDSEKRAKHNRKLLGQTRSVVDVRSEFFSMKDLKQLYAELESRKDFQIISKTFDGGMGYFTKGSSKGMSVIWSYAGGWEHVSIDGKTRMPTWDEMCQLKDMFFTEDECCIQYHPPKSEYVNNIPYCLHIWRPIEKYFGTFPVPPSLFVGIKGVQYET